MGRGLCSHVLGEKLLAHSLAAWAPIVAPHLLPPLRNLLSPPINRGAGLRWGGWPWGWRDSR